MIEPTFLPLPRTIVSGAPTQALTTQVIFPTHCLRIAGSILRRGCHYAVQQTGNWAELSRTKLAFTDHPLVPVHLVSDPISRSIVLSEEQMKDFIVASSRMIDAQVWEKFHRLADAVFVL
jgi:hypothetical protein